MNYDTIASTEDLQTTIKALEKKGIKTIVTSNESEALEEIKKIIPKGASVMNGASRTLEQIGFVEYLKSNSHGWNNLHKGIVEEKDPVKQSKLRKQGTLSDYYLGSVHALAKTGEFLIASNTGSQLPHIVFTSSHLIFVVGTQKIVPTLAEGLQRLESYVIPLEDENMKKKYGVGTAANKILLFKGENPMMGRSVHMILIKKQLGF